MDVGARQLSPYLIYVRGTFRTFPYIAVLHVQLWITHLPCITWLYHLTQGWKSPNQQRSFENTLFAQSDQNFKQYN